MKYFLEWESGSTFYQSVREDYKKLSDRGIIDRVSSKSPTIFRPPPHIMVSKEIVKPTYKVEFEVII
jgi:hypothetical protein